ncbi:MAG TPA: RNA 2',3'-cyclic phosphodiesterase [Thermoleophilaceae bacterium]|nr:RNA 2',3'-cyclic phosphodiesterase [Thermoleophilaceae bacterium]
MALDMPGPARAELARWRDAGTDGRSELRPVPEAQLHVTLVFLGGTPQADVGGLWEAASAAAAGLRAPSLTAQGVKGVPGRRPRLFALDLDDAGDRAGRLHTRVAEALERHEERAFWPHVTLARVRRGARAGPLAVSEAMPFDAFTPPALTLYRSQPAPGGARYTPLESVALSA